MDQAQNLRKSIEQYRKNKQEKPKSLVKTIAVASGKGGVGKTNFSVNLAIALKQSGNNVVVFDADLGLANVDVLIGAAPKHNLYDVIFNNKKLKDVIISGPAGIKIIPGGSGIESLSNLNDNQRKELSEKFGELTDTDVLIIDTSAGMSKNVLGFMAVSEDVVVVTTPEPTSITDAYSLIKVALKHMPSMNIHVVINRANSQEEAQLTYQRLENAVRDFLKKDIKYLGYIADDNKVRKAVMEQNPFRNAYPDCQASKCMDSIAASIMGTPALIKKTGGVKDFFSKVTLLFSKMGH
jgi:ATPases involved in chromosome partitioning